MGNLFVSSCNLYLRSGQPVPGPEPGPAVSIPSPILIEGWLGALRLRVSTLSTDAESAAIAKKINIKSDGKGREGRRENGESPRDRNRIRRDPESCKIA